MIKKVFAQASLPDYPAGFKFANSSVGDIISEFLPYVFTLAGVALFVMLIMGGVTIMTAAGDPGKTKQGYQMIEGAVVGFLIVFVSIFITQLVEVILGVKII